MEKEDDSTASFCLSFSSYTGDRIAETAERVRLEFSDESNGEHWDDEFAFVNCVAVSSSSNDFDFAFPIFDQILITKSSAVKSDESSPTNGKTQLRDLILRDNEDPSSSSSDEEEENGIISSEIYYPWTPEKSINGGWRKSKSTGSSQRWRIKDLLKRSYSEGKQSHKFLNSNSINREDESSKKKKKEKVSAHEKFYLKNKAMKEEEKRKSYLPYRKNIVGFFFNIHRYGKTFSRF